MSTSKEPVPSTASNHNEFPAELASGVREFQTSLTELEKHLKDLVDVPLSEWHEAKASTALDKAQLDCLSAFALNSLVWMWLRTKGLDPKETELKVELDRVKESMLQLKEARKNPPKSRIDKEASKRFVASSLWTPGERKRTHRRDDDGGAADGTPQPAPKRAANSKQR